MHLRDIRKYARLFQDAFRAWLASKSPRMGAALAYYTIFAVAPLFLLSLSMAGRFFGDTAARQEMFGQIYGLVGQTGGKAIQELVTAAADRPHAGLWATFGALVTLGLGASAVFVELKDALNTIWEVEPEPGHGIWHFIKDRLLSFAMMLGIGFVLLVSLVLNAALTALGTYTSGLLKEQHALFGYLDFFVSLGVITLLFAMIFKVLPDVKIAWSDVWAGAFVTALLFNLGKFLLGYYLGRSTMASIYGAAGSFIILLTWVYYSAQILFFGAEFTRLHSGQRAKSQNEAKEHRLTARRP